jgi:hypothetical protein
MAIFYKLVFLIIFFFTYQVFSQNIYKIIDFQTKEPISNVEFLTDNQVFFTNEDGEVKIPIEIKDSLTVSYPMFYPQIVVNNGKNRIIELVPVEKLLDEIIVNPYSAKRIFEETLKNYTSIYYDKPSEYDCTLKQKGILNEKINNLLIANIKIWMSFTGYDFNKKAKTNSFLQMSLNVVKYYKTQRENIQLIASDFIGLMFLNREISRILYVIEGSEIISQTSKIDDKNVLITFETGERDGVCINGEIIYNTQDKAITYLKTFSKQQNAYREYVDNDQNYKRYTKNFEASYSFVKSEKKYIPSQVEMKGNGYELDEITKEKTPFSGIQTIYFSTFSKGKSSGLKNKMDLSKNLTDNIPDKEVNVSDVLLSKEEKEFVKE